MVKDRVLFGKFYWLMKHTTKTQPLLSAEIEDKLHTSGVTVRKLVRELRRRSFPIASNTNGYFWAKNIGELQPTIDHLKARAEDEITTANFLINSYKVKK